MVGRQPAPKAALRIAGQEISADEVQVWITEHREKSVSLAVSCPALAGAHGGKMKIRFGGFCPF